jgi:pimeloyl-ACP methyl ester carboxylesterase
MEMRSILPALVVATVLLSHGTNSVQGKEIVLIHGGAHGAWCWFEVVALLQKAGFTCTTLDMASAGTRDKISADTISTIEENTQPLLDYLANNVTGQVVLVGHSIGGISISFAMERYPRKISHAIFLTAAMPANNQSLLASAPPSLIPRITAEQGLIVNFANGPDALPTSVSLNLTVAPAIFYNESPEVDIILALTLLDNQPYCTLSEVLFLTEANYGSVRRFYLQTDLDNVWGPGGEQYILNNNPPEKVFFINGSDHSAFFSKPRETAAYIAQIASCDDVRGC